MSKSQSVIAGLLVFVQEVETKAGASLVEIGGLMGRSVANVWASRKRVSRSLGRLPQVGASSEFPVRVLVKLRNEVPVLSLSFVDARSEKSSE